MPYKSLAQAAKFHILEKEGKISHETVKEWDNASRGRMGRLAYHVAKHKKKKK
jgi:hypothetical protein